MRKSFSQKPVQKKNRGVAVIFTLGILGLLTVMALGFASTALLNRKIADNTSSQDYARHIAKNIALARVKNAVMRNAVISNCYYSDTLTSYTVANGKLSQDFLHKMDTVLDGVELYRVTNDTGTIKIQENTARWQYVTDPDGKILGRYAYAVVPVSGHLDPVGNRGQTSVSGRFGFSEKEIGVYSLCHGEDGLTDAKASAAAGIKFRTFKEFVTAFNNLSDNNKKNLVNDGYRIQLGSSPEAFWIDTNEDGKKTKDEWYLRFNMPTSDSDWLAMTVDQLIGDGAGDSDANIKYSGSNNSISFIPWLKYWTHSHDDWTADLMKKQIAANILQYNRPNPNALDTEGNPYPTVSDQSGDWLENPPAYAGIGRHPMLNEIGISIRVKADVAATKVSADGDPEKWEYEPSYTITIENGVELINPFSLTPSSKCHVKFSNAQEISIMLRSFKEDLSAVTISSDDDLKKLFYEKEWSWPIFGYIIKAVNLKITGETATNKIVQIPQGLLSNQEPSDIGDPGNIDDGWTNFDFSREFTTDDWSSSVAYTKAEKFWKEQKRTVTFNKFTLDGTNRSAKIKELMKLYQARVKLGNTVLRYTSDAIANQRDFAKLSDISEFKFSHISFAELFTDSNCGKEISAKAWLGQCAVEAKDPLVNHYPSDWVVKDKYDGDCDDSTPSGIKEINKNYPGSVFDSDGDMGGDAYHLNSAAKASGSPVALLKDNENGSEVVLESATDPACSNTSRLSSSYIRHAPMKSLWELGFISRAEAFKTLNLGRSRVFDKNATYSQRGGGTFAQGDANILDQIKFSDTTDQKDVQGKIDLNARYHKVFEWIFNKDVSSASGTTVNWYQNLITGNAVDPFSTATPTDGSADGYRVVCNSTDCLGHQHSDSCTETCLAHLLMERSLILPFRNRSDLLLDPDADSSANNFENIPGYSDLDSSAQGKLKTLQRKLRTYLLNPFNIDSNEAKSKLVREQYATRFMNLFKADDNDEHVYIIVLAQSIKDIGGVPAFVDWDGNGEYTPADGTPPTCQATAKFMKTGYVRKKLDGTNDYQIIAPSSGSAPALDETKTTTTLGSYDYGADKITGETKLLVEMAKDANTGKWKIAGYRYVE